MHLELMVWEIVMCPAAILSLFARSFLWYVCASESHPVSLWVSACCSLLVIMIYLSVWFSLSPFIQRCMTLQNVTWGIAAMSPQSCGFWHRVWDAVGKYFQIPEAVLHIHDVLLPQFVSELCLCLFQTDAVLVWGLQALVPAPLWCTLVQEIPVSPVQMEALGLWGKWKVVRTHREGKNKTKSSTWMALLPFPCYRTAVAACCSAGLWSQNILVAGKTSEESGEEAECPQCPLERETVSNQVEISSQYLKHPQLSCGLV